MIQMFQYCNKVRCQDCLQYRRNRWIEKQERKSLWKLHRRTKEYCNGFRTKSQSTMRINGPSKIKIDRKILSTFVNSHMCWGMKLVAPRAFRKARTQLTEDSRPIIFKIHLNIRTHARRTIPPTPMWGIKKRDEGGHCPKVASYFTFLSKI